MQANLGASQYAAFANKCWPAFEKYFGHVPCYMNSRLAAKGIPVACEADIYGALSEYMSICATELPPAILDINNSVPKDMYAECKKAIGDYALTDLWMGFHCGNTSSACLMNPSMQHQLIMHRLMEPEHKPDITRGTLEGRIKSGPISIFRIQSTPESRIQAYMANGEVLDVNPRVLRIHRRVCDPGDGALLSSRPDRKEISASYGDRIQTRRQNALCCLQNAGSRRSLL